MTLCPSPRLLLLPLLVLSILILGCQRSPASNDTDYSAEPVALHPTDGPLPDDSLYHLQAEWTDQSGQSLDFEDLRGRYTLVTLGYATCRGACPRLAFDMKRYREHLTEEAIGPLALLFVSIDPETDTVEQLATFAQEQQLDAAWHLVRGDEEQVKELAALLGYQYQRVSETDFAHSNQISLLDPNGRLLQQVEGLGGPVEAIIPPSITESVSPTEAPMEADSCCEDEEH